MKNFQNQAEKDQTIADQQKVDNAKSDALKEPKEPVEPKK